MQPKPIVGAILVAAIAAAGALAACGDDLTSTGGEPTRTGAIAAPVTMQTPVQPTAAPQPTPAPKGEPLTDHTALTLFAEAMSAVGTAHVTGELDVRESVVAPGALILQTFSGYGQMDADSRFAGIVQVVAAGTFPFESRWVDGAYYDRDPATGKWGVVAPEAGQRLLIGLFESSLVGSADDMRDPTVTREVLDGAPVLRVDGAVDRADLLVSRKVLWIGEDDYLLRRIRLEGSPPPELVNGSQEGYFTLTADYSGYNQLVIVTAP